MSNPIEVSKILKVIFSPILVLLAIIVNFFIPRKGKRMLFAASLYAHVDHIHPDKMDEDSLVEYTREVERVLKMVSHEKKALMLPMFLHQYFWGTLDTNRILEFPTTSTLCNYVINNAPWYLKYDQTTMRRDIKRIVDDHKQKLLEDKRQLRLTSS